MEQEHEHELRFIAVQEIPLIKSGDNISTFILNACRQYPFILHNDIFIITQKIISKSESRFRDLRLVIPGQDALHFAELSGKDPRLVQLILEESSEVLRVRQGLMIVRHRLGFVCANAGIDHSNTVAGDRDNNMVLLLPEDPDRSALEIKNELEAASNKTLGVMIIDSHGRAWRNGTIGTVIGLAGVPGLVDLRGTDDLFGYTLKATQVAAADELAAGASLLMGQAAEGTPVVTARGFPYAFRESTLQELIRPEKDDLFK